MDIVGFVCFNFAADMEHLWERKLVFCKDSLGGIIQDSSTVLP